MSIDLRQRVQAAPGARRCCDSAGRMCALAARPLPVGELIARAFAQGEGLRAELVQRVEDLLAAGELIELE